MLLTTAIMLYITSFQPTLQMEVCTIWPTSPHFSQPSNPWYHQFTFCFYEFEFLKFHIWAMPCSICLSCMNVINPFFFHFWYPCSSFDLLFYKTDIFGDHRVKNLRGLLGFQRLKLHTPNPMKGTWVWSLIGELRSHMPQGVAMWPCGQLFSKKYLKFDYVCLEIT